MRPRPTVLKIGLAAALAIASSAPLWAQQDKDARGATTRPDGPTTRRGMRGDGPGNPGGPDGDGGGWQGGPPRRGMDSWSEQPDPTPEEWDEIEVFMRENSPVRLGLYQRLETEFGLERRITRMARRRIASRFRDIQNLKDRNSDLYDFSFKQLRLEDQALGTLLELRKQDTPELQAKLKEQMHAFVENSLNERQVRVQKLREFVAREEENLERDRKDLSGLEDKQRERFENSMRRMLDFSAEADGLPTTRPVP